MRHRRCVLVVAEPGPPHDGRQQRGCRSRVTAITAAVTARPPRLREALERRRPLARVRPLQRPRFANYGHRSADISDLTGVTPPAGR